MLEISQGLVHLRHPGTGAGKLYIVNRHLDRAQELAADVGGEGMNAGRGGWTWYTGSAAWLYRVMLEDVLGYERRGNRVRMCALLGPGWPSAKVKLRFGSSSYTLESAMVCRQAELDGMPQTDNWVEMIDDGAEHRAVFPARQTEN